MKRERKVLSAIFAGKMLAKDMLRTAGKSMDFQLDCLVDTSSTQDA